MVFPKLCLLANGLWHCCPLQSPVPPQSPTGSTFPAGGWKWGQQLIRAEESTVIVRRLLGDKNSCSNPSVRPQVTLTTDAFAVFLNIAWVSAVWRVAPTVLVMCHLNHKITFFPENIGVTKWNLGWMWTCVRVTWHTNTVYKSFCFDHYTFIVFLTDFCLEKL